MSSNTASSSVFQLANTPLRRLEVRRHPEVLGLDRPWPGRRQWDVEAFIHSIHAQGKSLKKSILPSLEQPSWIWLFTALLIGAMGISNLLTLRLSMRSLELLAAREVISRQVAPYTWAGFHRIGPRTN